MCPTVSKMGVRLRLFHLWCARWRILSCGDFATISQVRNTLQNGVSAAKWRISRRGKFAAISQLRNGGTRLRNGTRVPRRVFAAGARRLRNGFATEINFRSEKRDFRSGFWGLQKNFRSGMWFSQRPPFGCEISQAMLSPCFWAPLDSQLPYFTSFDIPPDFDHPKTYIISKQIKIKALKSKLKHWNQN